MNSYVLCTTLTCPCVPGQVFSSKATLSNHKKSKKHQAWELKQKEHKIDNTKRDNEIQILKTKLKYSEEQVENLINEKFELKKNISILENKNNELIKDIEKKTEELNSLAIIYKKLKNMSVKKYI
jgi:chromosome segregation ATPase